MKRFYNDVAVAQTPPGFALLLDGKPLKTPGGRFFAVSTRALAEAVAQEWRTQEEEIAPAAMPLTRLANTVLDGGEGRAGLLAALQHFGGHDLLCYRAQAPAELAARQRQWDDVLDWAAGRHGARLTVTAGINSVTQPEAACEALARAMAALDDYQRAALHVLASVTGSLVLGLAVLDGRLTAAQAFALSRLDEDYQAEKWGTDAGAQVRASALAAEMEAAAMLAALTRS